jgi:hypothetical protein
VEKGSGLVRQEVETSLINENDVVIERGLQKESRVMISMPADTNGLAWERLSSPTSPTASKN